MIFLIDPSVHCAASYSTLRKHYHRLWRETWGNRRTERAREMVREVYWQGSELGYSGELMPTRDGSASALSVRWLVDEDLNQIQMPWGLTGRHVSFMRCSCRVWLCLGCVVLQTVRLTDLTSAWLNVKMARGFGDCSTWSRHTCPCLDVHWSCLKDMLQLLHTHTPQIYLQLHRICGPLHGYCEYVITLRNALKGQKLYFKYYYYYYLKFSGCQFNLFIA